MAFVGGNTGNTSNVAAGSVTVTYSPTAGNVVVVILHASATPTTVTVADSGSTNVTSRGSTTDTSNSHTTYVFAYFAGSGVTSFKASVSTNVIMGMSVLEYNGSLTIGQFRGNFPASANSSPTITMTSAAALSSIVVFGIAYGAQTLSGVTGTNGTPNSREPITTTSTRLWAGEMTLTSTATFGISGTLSANFGWMVVGLELDLALSNQLMMVGCGT